MRAFLTLALALVGPLAGVAADWPQWRGPARDGHAGPDETLPSALPDALAPRWTRPVGPAFSGPVVVGSRVFHVDEQGGQETAHALDAASGKTLWSTPYGASTGDEWGTGPRCTPLADDGRLYVQSLRGSFACLDVKDGRRLWGFDFDRDYGVSFLGGSDQSDAAARRRGNTGAPVILGDRVYVSVGSTNGANVVCFDKRSGSELWRSGTDEAAYAALVAGPLAGRAQLVAYTAFALVGFDPDRGAVLWRVPQRTHANRHAVTPVFVGDALVVSSHSVGTRSIGVSAAPAGGFAAGESWAQPALKTSLATLVLVEGHLYGQGPDRNFVCLEAATGKTRWSQRGFGDKPLTGYSSTIACRNRLLALSDNGQLTLLEANPSAYTELGRAQVCGKTWSHPAYAGGTLYLRDSRQLSAYAWSPGSAEAGK
ncbi:MAG: PQQ-like beta-propeller repeat protein [Verrucomicrobiales bacterium]|nr:PQQ-like beta-propeller repeat protein [Verrucomicrobiales bacterium]